MLKRLSVRNYTLIESLEFCPGEGFNALTGETGAGKSILLGALGLILGNRADTQVHRNPEQKCVVEGTFVSLPENIHILLEENDLDPGSEMILRREILPGGKSRAFVNDIPVNLTLMKEVGEKLVDIHSQHENLMVNESGFQLDVVDDFAGNHSIRSEFQSLFRQFRQTRDLLTRYREEESKANAEKDFLRYQLDELQAARLKPGEQKELEEELDILTHAGEIRNRLNGLLSALDQEEGGILNALSGQLPALQALARYSVSLGEATARWESCIHELKDLHQEFVRQADLTQVEPARVEFLTQRLDTLFRLQQKHRVQSVEELTIIAAGIEDRLQNIASLADNITLAGQQLEELTNRLEELSQQLRNSRANVLFAIEQQLKDTLADLGMPGAVIRIEMEKLDNFSDSGKDKVRFLFSANQGQEPRPVSKVASGGEISRLMLAVKSLISHRNMIPVIVFDEIDSGVSGSIAGRTGQVMLRMAMNMQVIVITHIPQIAARGQHHFFVYKETREGNTQSAIKELNAEERVRVIAGMLSNQNITTAATEAAKQLLQ